ncbi:putative RNA methyltransferase [Streptomyces seoulensis]|uniref:putative RNA methyltransferase n=1 Tax=Streptomyces seoulensis TaxID=73044 RepID=UPI0004CD767F|nr:methyltransferase type 11 [Streptomyces seoulensis]
MPVSLPPALDLSLDLLRCPTCRTRRLHPDRGALRCPVGHTFDIARHGYAGLLTGARATSGDDAAMVQARDRFLSTGAYEPLREVGVRLAVDAVPGQGTVVDAGCGTGYHLAGVLDRLPSTRGLGLETSVRALRSAARAHDRAAAVAWDVFRPFPLADGAADVVLNVFAGGSRCGASGTDDNAARCGARRREPGVIDKTPPRRHLAELRGQMPAMVTIDPAKEQRLHRALDPLFEAVVTQQVEYCVPLTKLNILDLIGMTPSARHVSRADLADGGALPDQVTVSVLATAYRPR